MSPILDDPRGTFTGAVPTVYPPNVPTVYPPRANKRPTLNLGVLVQPYRSEDNKSTAVTTGDVAQILEAKYGIMKSFARAHHKTIETAVTVSVTNALEALVMGRRIDPFGAGMQQIQSRFKQFISSAEAERVGIPGTPTGAAMRGVNHRRKHPYKRSNPRRPSFYDTHLYANSMRAWISHE